MSSTSSLEARHENDCTHIYAKLLNWCETGVEIDNIPVSRFVNWIMTMTPRCDSIHDMSELRLHYSEKLSMAHPFFDHTKYVQRPGAPPHYSDWSFFPWTQLSPSIVNFADPRPAVKPTLELAAVFAANSLAEETISELTSACKSTMGGRYMYASEERVAQRKTLSSTTLGLSKMTANSVKNASSQLSSL